MELRVVTTEKGKILVDESAKIREGDWYIDDTNQIRQSITSDKHYWAQRFNYYKVIATINHSIDLNVPMVIVEDEAEKLAIDYDKSKFRNFKREHTTTEFYETAIDGIIAGYKAAQQKGVYSEEDMEEAFQQGMDNVDNDGCYIDKIEIAFKECIEYLKQEYIELEMETINQDYRFDVGQITKIKTIRVDGQLMAYLKQ